MTCQRRARRDQDRCRRWHSGSLLGGRQIPASDRIALARVAGLAADLRPGDTPPGTAGCSSCCGACGVRAEDAGPTSPWTSRPTVERRRQSAGAEEERKACRHAVPGGACQPPTSRLLSLSSHLDCAECHGVAGGPLCVAPRQTQLNSPAARHELKQRRVRLGQNKHTTTRGHTERTARARHVDRPCVSTGVPVVRPRFGSPSCVLFAESGTTRQTEARTGPWEHAGRPAERRTDRAHSRWRSGVRPERPRRGSRVCGSLPPRGWPVTLLCKQARAAATRSHHARPVDSTAYRASDASPCRSTALDEVRSRDDRPGRR